MCPKSAPGTSTTAFCYTAREAPVDEPIILLNGEGRSAGPVNNVAVMSAVSSQYAPPGEHLVVASVVGEAPEDHAWPACAWSSPSALIWPSGLAHTWATWRMLKAYPLTCALPQQRHAEWEQNPVRLASTGGCLHVWRLPRDRLNPGRVRLRKTRRRGRLPRLCRASGHNRSLFDATRRLWGKIEGSKAVARLDTPQ